MPATELTDKRESESRSSVCPRCGKECRPDETFCLYCDQELSKPVRPRLGLGQFSLAFLLGVMMLVAVTLAGFRAAPDVTVALLILFIPALGRTAVSAYLRRRRGGQHSLSGLAITFLVSLAAMIPVLTLAFAGFIGGMFVAVTLGPVFTAGFPPLGRVFLLAGPICSAAGACYGFWITRPSE